MIKSFRCRDTEKLFLGGSVKQFRAIEKVCMRKLEMLDAAQSLIDLQSPPGNRLKTLKGERREQFSIRINEKYRICFRWVHNAAYDVEIVDYH